MKESTYVPPKEHIMNPAGTMAINILEPQQLKCNKE
jgi:hypothetical protein